jgi:hypothetical protein
MMGADHIVDERHAAGAPDVEGRQAHLEDLLGRDVGEVADEVDRERRGKDGQTASRRGTWLWRWRA